jgi:hypothetical protein
MDNLGNSFNDDDYHGGYNEGSNLSPSPRRGMSCGAQALSVLSVVVALLAFLFGDNILGRRHPDGTPSAEANTMPATSIVDIATATATATKSPDDYELIIDNLVWEHSLNEPNIYNIDMVSSEQLSNFDLEVTVRFEDEQDEFHGVVFRRVNDDRYRFQITPQGEYAIYKDNETDHTSLIGPLHSNSILTGKGQLNKIRVRAVGSAFEFYINDKLVTKLTETGLPSGGIGLYTCTCNGSDSSSVSFYDLKILSLP